MSRKKSREKAMELLFSITLSKDSVEEAMEVFVDNYEDNIKELDLDYIKNLLNGVEANKEEIDKIIEKNLQNWKLDRISKVNLTILRLGVYEIAFDENVPKKVALNEAIELGKLYSDQKSVSFINGVLDKVLKTAQEENKMGEIINGKEVALKVKEEIKSFTEGKNKKEKE